MDRGFLDELQAARPGVKLEIHVEFPEYMLRKDTFGSVSSIRRALEELSAPQSS